MTTEQFVQFGDPGLWWKIPICSAALLSLYVITRPRQGKPPNLNPEQSIWFSTADILKFKYRQEQRHEMTQRAHSFLAEGYSTHPETLSKSQHVVWQRGTPVNKIWWKGNLSPTNPCLQLPNFMFRALWTHLPSPTRRPGEAFPFQSLQQMHPLFCGLLCVIVL